MGTLLNLRIPRLGVGPALMLAVIALSLFVVVCGAIALSSFNAFHRSFDRLASTQTNTLIATAKLQQESEALAGYAPKLLAKGLDQKSLMEFSADVYAYLTADPNIRLWGTLVQAWPWPEGALFQNCVDKYAPLYRNRNLIEQFPSVFPLDSSGKPASDNISLLVDMFFNPSLVPVGPTIRSLGPATNSGQAKYMLSRYLKERGDANITSIRDLINR